MKLTVVIVSYNVRPYLEQCLNSLRRALHGLEAEVYVVDNHSKDDTVEKISRLYPEVNLVASNHNLGFARANNIAIKQTESEYVLLLNPDTFVGEHVISDCLRFMDEHEDAGALGVRMLDSNGNVAMESRRGLPTPMTAFYKMVGLCKRFPQSRVYGKYYMNYLPWDKPVEIEVVSGAFCMLRREALDKAGLLDEDFFMYGEDIDLSCRLLNAGFRNWYYPAEILHYKGESTQKSSFRYVHVFYEAMFIFFRKHYGNMTILISLPIRAAILFKASMATVALGLGRLRKMLGFYKERERYPDYVFIGREGAIKNCRRISRKFGLTARFYTADSKTMPEGHNSIKEVVELDSPTYIVYDIDAYSYEEILQIFGSNPKKNLIIGTFDSNSNRIITFKEVVE
ncbi:MAG: glycosyltransferase family 2 protein [Prevotella sp.]|uniref:glycosyltransferase family 2 protein n=1 Tax=Prevotella sp. TaxID=59823 RepID=UPI002A2F1078|nr:glycosyltransferase family 2 protein [Prevotella sp.]MDD7318194.1 glycosyltransferase family 2 protein [Prevotellaceae bacterium]MDY4020917.1 glycosyltransferase family 2 protein [Prevotella sp.]